ncbi:MerR family transcriptional regulator [Acuticoccus yangtzensis]|uniref:MerR family transcriptional regulator n=1 Tax=Acuticoccus yangtzensis TaxID=1443441 RepID=UPI000949AF8F|nr:MerR family transcriptional regulator [Acuticoccus yangtzensis]
MAAGTVGAERMPPPQRRAPSAAGSGGARPPSGGTAREQVERAEAVAAPARSAQAEKADAHAAEREAGEGRGLVDAERLADEVGVPASVLTYLEARLPGVHAIAEGRRRLYRPADAALIAGCAELLYGEGRSFREVMGYLRAGKSKAIARRGWALLGEIETEPAPESGAPSRAIPADALVQHRGRPGPTTPLRPTEDPSAILADLIECVRLLEAAR